MGNYTGVRVRGFVKPEYKEMALQIYRGVSWSEFKNLSPLIEEYSSFERADSIPHGSLCYMPYSWDDDDEYDPWKSFSPWSGYWSISCSLKNTGEVKFFIDKLLPEIFANTSHIEVHYDEWEYCKFYKLKNGVVYPSEEEE